ncbi:virginiamycin B lyase family protein [Zobellella aerophila]|uniref:Lyase n=1 Tax=Zobellella aerophila TaxID=870480 RepID=A0ABP6VRZ3_9GAMM
MRFIFFALGVLLAPWIRAEAVNETVAIQEWPVPWAASRPRDPQVDPGGGVWFCGQAGNYIARFDPETGQFRRFELAAGTHPHNLVVDGSGMIWYAGNRNAHIGRLDPRTGEITRFAMPDPAVRDPHTLILDNGGNLWFTAQDSNYIGRLNIASGEIKLVPVTTPGARPYGIKIDGQGRPWVALFGTNRLAMVEPRTLVLTEVTLPREQARVRRLEITANGDIWYLDFAGGRLGRYQPGSRSFSEWPIPGQARAQPYGSALDGQDRIWLVDVGSRPNRLMGFDPVGSRFFGVTLIPSGAGAVRHMYYHPRSNSIWFGTDANTLGQARLGP